MADISKLSINELKQLQEDARLLIEQKKDQAILDAFNKIHEIASNLGFSVQELLNEGEKRLKKSTRKAVIPRYRNKTNDDETWTGRGKQPRWLVAELDKGARLEDFLI